MLVRRHPLAEDAEGGVAVALRHVTQHLVVRPVLLDDVDDVLEEAGLADALGDRHGGNAGAGREERPGDALAMIVLPNGRGESGKVRGRGDGNEGERAVILMGVESGAAGQLVGPSGRLQALDVGDAKLPEAVMQDDRSGEPADGNEPKKLRGPAGRLEFDDRHGVLGPVGDVKDLPPAVEGQRVRRGTEEVGRARLRPDGLDDGVGPRVDDAQGVARRVGADDVPAAGGEGEGRGMEADRDLRRGPSGAEVDHGDRTVVGDARSRVDPDRRAPAGGADRVAGAGTPPSPVADVGFGSGEDDIVRGHADVEEPEETAAGGFEFAQAVGEVQGYVQAAPVGRDGDPGRDLHLAARGAGGRQGDREQTLQCPARPGTEDLEAPLDVAKVEAAAVRGERKARVADLGFLVRAQDVLRWRSGRVAAGVGREGRPLQERPGRRVDDDNLARSSLT